MAEVSLRIYLMLHCRGGQAFASHHPSCINKNRRRGLIILYIAKLPHTVGNYESGFARYTQFMILNAMYAANWLRSAHQKSVRFMNTKAHGGHKNHF